MKKTSFVIAILASALLAGACGKKKDAAAPTPPATGSDAPAAGSDAPAAGSGSAM
jgi:nitrous oxide reductase accessory protein NosL